MKTEVTPFIHQLQSLYLMKKAEADPPTTLNGIRFYSRIGILANTPGSGKTLVILSLCNWECTSPKADLNCLVSRTTSYSYYPQRREICVNIIVTDNAILQNAWIPDIQKFFDSTLTWILISNGKIPGTNTELDALTDEQLIGFVEQYHIMLISKTMFYKFFRIFRHVIVRRIIFDEIQSLAITHEANLRNYIDHPFLTDKEIGLYNELLPANFIWVCTATPEDIRTGKKDSKRTNRYITNYIVKNAFFLTSNNYPELTNKYVIKFPDEYILSFTEIPRPNIIDILVKKPKVLKLVENLIDDQIIDMIRNDQIDDAIETLNKNKNENEVGVGMYDAALKQLKNELTILEAQYNLEQLRKAKEERLQNTLKEINAVANKISELHKRFERIKNQLNDNECKICFDNLINATETTCCNAVYCFKCISLSITVRQKCPQCNGDITFDKFNVLKTDKGMSDLKVEENREENMTTFLDKSAALRHVLSYTNKSLLYIRTFKNESDSNYVERIKNIVLSAGVKPFIVKGIDKNRMHEYIDKFRKSGERTCWILESELSSAGLNFEFVDSIITYDKYKSERQIMYRGLRPGRKTVMNFFRILFEDISEF